MERKHEKYERLIARCRTLPPVPCAVVHPCDESSLRGAVEAAYRHNAQPNNGRPDVEAFGWNAQIGYMVVPEKFEIGLRYAQVSWEGTTGISPPTLPIRQSDRECLGVLGYYWHGHDMKLQLDFGRVETHNADGDAGPSASNIDEWRARIQFQIVF
jgi:hypothetical protein